MYREFLSTLPYHYSADITSNNIQAYRYLHVYQYNRPLRLHVPFSQPLFSIHQNHFQPYVNHKNIFRDNRSTLQISKLKGPV